MKYIFFACSILLFACAQKQPSAENTTAPAAAGSPVAAVSGKLPDPVCEMPYDTSYKEGTGYKTETLQFCEATGKNGFEKAPEKYRAKLGR